MREYNLVQAMGATGISKCQVSRFCEEIDEQVDAFLSRPIAGERPYLSIDATYLEVRQGCRVVRRRHHRGRREYPLSANCCAIACRAMDGRLEVLGGFLRG